MKLKLILTTATVGVALALPSISNAAPAAVASAEAARATQPTLSLKKDCETFPGINSVNITLAGLPPFTEFEATRGYRGVSPSDQHRLRPTRAAALGSVTVGTQEPGTSRVTVVWPPATLVQSLFVDCSAPASKEECKNGGWRDFPQFKNQGQCIAFVNHGP